MKESMKDKVKRYGKKAVAVGAGVMSAAAPALATGTDYSTGVTVDTTTLGGSATILITALAIVAGIGLALKLWRGRA